MASTPTTVSNSKPANSPKISSSASPLSAPPTASVAGNENFGQRRSGGSGTFGASAWSRPSAASRNSNSKKSHKPSKKFRFDDDAIAEAATMRSSTNRKGQTSITHLMNFALPPRPYYSNYRSQNYRHDRRHASSWSGSSYYADKARYVYANYRFIVDPRQAYYAQSMDSDEYLDWDSVLQIIVSSQSQSSACPICLDHPAAPRMAKCGHVFCLQCLIRFMNSEEEQLKSYEKRARHKKCPLCWEPIYMSDLRPVRWYAGAEGPPPREGTDICLRLIKRSIGSTLALPRDGAEQLSLREDVPWYFAAEVMDYARIMKGSEEYMYDQLDRDIAEVEQQEKENELVFGDDTLEWTKRALRVLREAKERIKGVGGPSADPTSAQAKHLIDDYVTDAVPNKSTVSSGTNIVQPGLELTARDGSGNSPPLSDYYFYQGLLHYYLSPLDIRILKEAFGSFASFPATILPRVERISAGHVVDDDLRKKSKWLGHLPRGCEVCFLECDWTDTVPTEILEKFSAEIERRRQRNEEKETREERARLKAEKEEDQRYAHLRRRIPDESQPSWYRENDFQPLVHQEGDATEVDPSTSPPWSNRSQGSAFASLANMSTSPSASRTVWGTPVVHGSSPKMAAVSEEMHAPDDGWLQDWEKDLLNQEDELVAQAQALSVIGESSKSASGKKKKKKITLMSTTVRRGA